ncbi:MAG: coniferyl aldehyde dehydrogenase [Methyloceanibacter sp.]
MTLAASADTDSDLTAILARQRAAFLRDGPPSPADRRRDLMKLKHALLAHRNDLVAAVNADYGHRAEQETLLLDLGSSIGAIKYLHDNLARWMRPERRSVAMVFFPGSNRVLYQPLGVVGVVAPWNYPLNLALVPLATALAAGNRVMLKPSEFVPATTELLESLLAAIFDEEQVAVVTGGEKIGRAFSALPFDHLLFTGSIPVGRAIMRAASDNLVPVTLELGGKSPVIVERGASSPTAVRRIAYGKLANGGQTCVAPDYALLPDDEIEDFVATYKQEVEKLYPDIASNPDYTWIVNDQHFARLSSLVENARAKGARVIELGTRPAASQSRLFPPVLLLDVTDEMDAMKEEIFGPILPIVPYRALEDAVAYVNTRPRPLALYYFGPDGPGRRLVLERTTSGGVTINDTLLHGAQEDLPFGGVGHSGMGAYHGPEGFKTMSHAKGVYEQPRWNLADGVRPTFGKLFDLLAFFMLR